MGASKGASRDSVASHSNRRGLKMAKCKGSIEFADDYGDNETTFHCQLEEGHRGPCIEAAIMGGLGEPDKHYGLMWVEMERRVRGKDNAREVKEDKDGSA